MPFEFCLDATSFNEQHTSTTAVVFLFIFNVSARNLVMESDLFSHFQAFEYRQMRETNVQPMNYVGIHDLGSNCRKLAYVVGQDNMMWSTFCSSVLHSHVTEMAIFYLFIHVTEMSICSCFLFLLNGHNKQMETDGHYIIQHANAHL